MSSKVSFLHRQKGIAEFIGSLLLESAQSHFFHYVIFFVSNVQFLAILLQGQFSLISADDQDTLTTFTSKFTEIFVLDCIANTTEKVGYSILLIIIWIYFILLIKVIAIAITCHIRALPLSKLCYKITYKCLEIHFSIVFWVANMILMTTFSPNKGKEYLFGNLVTNHTALEVINIIFIIINYIVGLFGAWVCFVPFKGHLFSTHDSSLQMLNFLFKGVMAVLFMACNIESLAVQIIYIAVACIICASKFYILYKEFPYYNHLLMKIVTIFCAIEGCIVLNNIPAIAFGQTDKGSVVIALYIDIVLFPVGIKLALTCLNKVINHYLVVDYNQFKSENDVFRKLYAFDLCVSQVNMGVQGFNNISETYFIGKVLYHAETCKEPSCPCKDFITKPNKEQVISDKDKKKSFDSYLYMNKYRILSDCIKNIKDSDHLKISLAHLIFEYQSQGISSALSFLFSTSNDLNTLLSVKKYILTLNIQKKISVYFMERHNGVLNLKEFLDYSLVKNSFTQSLISNTDKYLEFWELYNDIDIKVIDLLKSSIKMEKEADEIAQVWKTYSESTEAFYHRMKDPYSAYLSLVRNSPATSENILRKFAWRHPPKRPEAVSESLLLPEDLTQNNTISVYVSMAKDKVGKILYISNNSTDMIGYAPEELIDKPVDYLMPPSYADKHREILIQHLEKSKTSESRDYAMVVGLVRTKKGHVLPATTYVSIFPYVQKELVYIAMIKILNYNYEQILFDSKGYVDGFSETIGKNLNLTVGKKYHIKDLTSDLNDISTSVTQHNHGGAAYSYGPRKQADENVKARRNSVDANKSPPKRQMTYYVSKQRNSMYKSLATACEQNYDGFTRSATFTRQADAGARSDSNEPFQKYHIAIVQVPLLDVKLHIVVVELQVNRNVEKMISQGTPDALSQKMLSLPKDSVVTFDDLENSAADLALPVTDALQQEKKFVFIERILSDDQQQEQQVKKFELNPKNNSLEADTQLPSSMKMERKESTLMTFEQRKMIAKNETHNTNNNESSNEVAEKNHRKQKDDDLPSDKAFSTATSGNLNPKFEQAAYSIPKSQGFQLVQISGLGLLGLCIILHVVFAVCAGNYLDLIKGNTEVLSSSGIRLFQLTEMHKRTKLVAMVNDMYISNYRYISLGITDAKSLAISAIGDIQNSLKNMNNLVRSSLYKIESSLEIQFFNGDIPVYQGGQVTRYSNGFDLIDDLVAVGKKLSKTPAAEILEGDHNLNFILTNTLNEIFVDCENVNGIIVSDSEFKFDSMKKMDLAFILVIVALGICVFFLYFREEREMKVSRNKLIEIFLRINSAEIQQSLIDVRRLRNLLATDISEQKLPNLKRNLMIIKAKQKKELTTGSNSKFRKKNAITRDINHHIVIARFLVFLFPVCCLVPFIYSNVSISNQSDTLMTKIASMVEFNQDFYELGLISASLYDYITSNGTSYLRTRPIDAEWEATFSSLTRAQTFLSNLPSQNSEDDGNSTTPPLSQIISGDLCTAVPLKGIPTSFCYGFGSGVLKQGILGVNSFIFMAFRAVKDQFDSSARQFADGQTALALTVLINAELISSVWQNNAYLLLGQELQTILEDEIDKTIDHTMIGLAVYIIFSLIFGPLLLYYIWKLVDKERVEWKKILRKVPFNVLITNTPLKNYLIKESGYMFGSSI